MCRVLGVSTSGYYAWRERPPSKRAVSDVALLERIRAIHKHSRGTYGVPRIFEELKAEGTHVGRKRIARLMKAAGLQGVSRRRSTWTTRTDKDARPAPDLVSRDLVNDKSTPRLAYPGLENHLTYLQRLDRMTCRYE